MEVPTLRAPSAKPERGASTDRDAADLAAARRDLLARRVAIGAVALPVLVVLAAAWQRRWTADDAFIDFRVVRNILDGHGPVFNAGDRVEAYTSPAWVGLLTVFSFLTRASIEWVSVVLGLVTTALGFGCAGRAGVLLTRRGQDARDVAEPKLIVPFGLLVLAALPPVWDFATSGLETGGEFAWLGSSFLLLTRIAVHAGAAADRPRLWPVALLLGFGPLVRPEFALFMVVWIAVLLALAWPGWRRAAATVAVTLVPGVAYEIFRMGFFASLVPNTALAKEAGTARWADGWQYLTDAFGPYLLVIPLAVLAAWWGHRTWRGALQRKALVLSAATLGAAVLYGLYVVRLGGDFMHFRMLLPPLFAAALPVAVIRLAQARDVAAWGAVAAWCMVCATSLRVPFGLPPERTIVDEAAFWTGMAHRANAVTLADHGASANVSLGLALQRAAQHGRAVLLIAGETSPRRPHGTTLASFPEPVVATLIDIGQTSLAAGADVYVVDRRGLADSVAARLLIADASVGRVGHQKLLPDVWVLARYADPATLRDIDADQRVQVDEARRALTCDGALRDVITATTAPLTPSRFLANITHAWSFTTLRLPADPTSAEAAVCR